MRCAWVWSKNVPRKAQGPTGLEPWEEKKYVAHNWEAMKFILNNLAYKRIRTVEHLAKKKKKTKAITENPKLLLRFNGGNTSRGKLLTTSNVHIFIKAWIRKLFFSKISISYNNLGPLIYTFILFSWDSYNYAPRTQHKTCLMTHTHTHTHTHISLCFITILVTSSDMSWQSFRGAAKPEAYC